MSPMTYLHDNRWENEREGMWVNYVRFKLKYKAIEYSWRMLDPVLETLSYNRAVARSRLLGGAPLSKFLKSS